MNRMQKQNRLGELNKVIGKSNIKRRNNYDMMNDILFCCKDTWISKSNINGYVGMATKYRKLVEKLHSNKLLEEKPNPNWKGGKQYITTLEGFKYMRCHFEMMILLEK